MTFAPCLVIPVYNHGAALGPVLQALAGFRLPCLVVDDGSDRATAGALRRLAGEHRWVELLRRPINGGKGAAVMDGFRRAAQRGFSHAVQIDADGQHDVADVPRFVEAARAHPAAVILGCPRFDDSVPVDRLLGRQISRALVWLTTLSLDIADPLCGFRCYPLDAVTSLVQGRDLGKRMDFDPDIAVRLQWAGVPVINVETAVTYPRGGLSHYDRFADNLRMTSLHVRLLVEAIGHVSARIRWRGARP